MTQLLLFLSIGLSTILVFVLKRLRQEQRSRLLARMRLQESAEFALQQQSESLNEAIATIQRLEKKVRSLENETQALQNEKAILQRKSDKLYGDLEKTRLLETQIEEFEKRVTELSQENQQLRIEKDSAQQQYQDLYEEIGKDKEEKAKKLELQIRDLESTNAQLVKENQELKVSKSTVNQTDVIVLKLTERDLYPSERRDIVIDTLKDSLRSIPEKERTRRYHIISDILTNNSFESDREAMKQELKILFNDYKGIGASLKKGLKRLGFIVTSEKNHPKLVFHSDPRYQFTFAATPSDSQRAGRNNVSEICNKLF